MMRDEHRAIEHHLAADRRRDGGHRDGFDSEQEAAWWRDVGPHRARRR
jgi:hypothetical protein